MKSINITKISIFPLFTSRGEGILHHGEFYFQNYFLTLISSTSATHGPFFRQTSQGKKGKKTRNLVLWKKMKNWLKTSCISENYGKFSEQTMRHSKLFSNGKICVITYGHGHTYNPVKLVAAPPTDSWFVLRNPSW